MVIICIVRILYLYLFWFDLIVVTDSCSYLVVSSVGLNTEIYLGTC